MLCKVFILKCTAAAVKQYRFPAFVTGKQKKRSGRHSLNYKMIKMHLIQASNTQKLLLSQWQQ